VHLEVPRTVSTVRDTGRERCPSSQFLLSLAAVYYALSFVCVGAAVSFVRHPMNVATSAVPYLLLLPPDEYRTPRGIGVAAHWSALLHA